MTETNLEVWNLLERDPSIRKCLAKGLINLSSLAKYIIKTTNTHNSQDSILSVLRRYNEKADYAEARDDVKEILKKASIQTKEQISFIVLKSEDMTMRRINDVLNMMKFFGTDTFNVVKGDDYIVLICDAKNVEMITAKYLKDELVEIKNDIGEINLRLGTDVRKTVGVFATILNELAINDINVVEAITCVSHDNLYVDEADLPKAHMVLSNLKKKFVAL